MDFFKAGLSERDAFVAGVVKKELKRQKDGIELIASENIVSNAVLEAQGSVLTNKYAEGYPGKRYYAGCEYMDEVESEAISRLTRLFGCNFANVQPHSGASANHAVFLACLTPGDTIMGLALSSGGHLTHGCKANESGKWFNAIEYTVDEQGFINYDEVERLTLENKPKLIIAGFSSYSRVLDWKRFRDICDKVGAIMMADIAHIAGLVAGGVYPSPFPYADIVTSTTHKTLRGPRGGVIMWNNEELTKKINSAVFPGSQGGPLMHVIAGKCVAFGEALEDNFKDYAKQVLKNAQILAKTLVSRGLKVVTGGTDCHLLVVDLTPYNLTGTVAEVALERAGLTCNKNAIPFDKQKPMITSGIRLGTPAGTTRGFKEAEFEQIAHLIADVLAGIRESAEGKNEAVEAEVRQKVLKLCQAFPIY
jgi:glycine hydroxymethyltransferase